MLRWVMQTNVLRNSPEIKWTLIYVVLATLWILTSDWVLARAVGAVYETTTTYQTVKGTGFVLVTGALLFAILRHNRQRDQRQRDLLQQSNQQREVLFRNNPQPMWIYDLATLHFLDVNASAVRQYGYNRDEFLAMTIKDIRPPDALPNLTENLQQTRPLLQDSGEWQHRLKDGTLRDVRIISHLIQYQEREAVLVTAYDITEQKALEKRLEEQTDLRARLDRELELRKFRQQFMSMMSHQFRTPLTTIGMSSNLMFNYCQRGDSPAKVQEHYERINTQVQRLDEMLNDIMEMFETETLQLNFNPAPLDYCAYLRDIAAENYFTERVSLHLPDAPVIVYADEKLLAHTVDNLISNALKYSPPDSRVDVWLEQRSGSAYLQVQDHGVGIPQTDIPRLFDPFYRGQNVSKIPGNGLGLSIVAQTVELHGGEIDVQSAVDEGTTFSVRLPLKEQFA